jgi:hypothetical protein
MYTDLLVQVAQDMSRVLVSLAERSIPVAETTTQEDAQRLRRSEIARLEAKLADAERKYSSCEELCKEQFQAFQEQLAKKEERFLQLQHQVTTSSSRFAQVSDTDLQNLTARNTRLEAELASHQLDWATRNTHLEEQLSSLGKQITELQQENSNLEEENTQLQFDSQFDSEVIGDEHANSSLGASSEEVYADLRDQIQSVTTELEASRWEALDLRTTDKANNSTIADLKRQLAEHAQKAEVFEATLANLRRNEVDQETTIETLGRQRDEQEQLSGTEREAYEALQKELTELRGTCVPQEATQKELTDLRGIRVASDLAIDAERQKLASMTTENRHLREAVSHLSSPESYRHQTQYWPPDEGRSTSSKWRQSDYAYIASQSTVASLHHVYIRVLEPPNQDKHVRSILFEVRSSEQNMKYLVADLQRPEGDERYDMWIVLPSTDGKITCTHRRNDALPTDVTKLAIACNQNNGQVFFANETVFLSFFKRYQDAYRVLTTQRPKRVGDRLEPAKGKRKAYGDNIRMTDQDEASDSQQSRRTWNRRK